MVGMPGLWPGCWALDGRIGWGGGGPEWSGGGEGGEKYAKSHLFMIP